MACRPSEPASSKETRYVRVSKSRSVEMHLELVARLMVETWLYMDSGNIRIDVHDEHSAVVRLRRRTGRRYRAGRSELRGEYRDDETCITLPFHLIRRFISDRLNLEKAAPSPVSIATQHVIFNGGCSRRRTVTVFCPWLGAELWHPGRRAQSPNHAGANPLLPHRSRAPGEAREPASVVRQAIAAAAI